MIILVYKDGKKEDVTKLFTGRVDTQNYYQALWLLAGLEKVQCVKLCEHPEEIKQTLQVTTTIVHVDEARKVPIPNGA